MNHLIHIFGASGSGTTTLGSYISERLGYFHMDTDDYYWIPTSPPYTTKRKPVDRIKRMREDIEQHGNVVLSGSMAGWGDELIPLFTLAVRIETDTCTRLERIKARERKRFGSRIEPGGDMYDHHKKFLEWAASYDTGGLDTRSRAKHDKWQTQLSCPLVIVDGNVPLKENLERIKSYLGCPPQ